MKNTNFYFRHIIGISILMLVFATFSNGQNSNELVSNLYKAHKKNSIASWSKNQLKQYFTNEFTNKFYKEANSEEGLGADPLFDTQDDSDIKNFKITNEKSTQNGYVFVSASFKNFGESKKVTFKIDKKTNKIADISYKGQKKSFMQY